MQRRLSTTVVVGLAIPCLMAMAMTSCTEDPPKTVGTSSTGSASGGAGGAGGEANGGAAGVGGMGGVGGVGGAGGCAAPMCSGSDTDTLAPLSVLASQNGKLDIVLRAKSLGKSIALDGTNSFSKAYAYDGWYKADGGGTDGSTPPTDPAKIKGGTPGPALVVKPGDNLSILVLNELDPTANAGNPTNLHTHGLHIGAGRYDDAIKMPVPPTSDNIYVMIDAKGMAGATMTSHQYIYEKIPADHPTGLFWYHPHNHMSSDPQVLAGLAGALVVSDPMGPNAIPEVEAAVDRVMVMQRVPSDTSNGSANTWLINGQYNPTIKIQPGEVQRWRILNASADDFFYFAVGDAYTSVSSTVCPELPLYGACQSVINPVATDTFTAIATDGISLPVPMHSGIPLVNLRKDTSDGNLLDPAACQSGTPPPDSAYAPGFLISPGQRLELLVRFNECGSHTLVTQGLYAQSGATIGPAPDMYPVSPPQNVAKVVVQGEPKCMKEPTTLVNPCKWTLDSDMRKVTPNYTRAALAFSRTMISGSNVWTIDGKPFDETMSHFDALTPPTPNPKVTTSEQWELTNNTTVTHPFHIHVNPFQVTNVNGVCVPSGTPTIYQDTVALPPALPLKSGMTTATPGSMTFRTRFQTYSNINPVFHCHLLGHEDKSMMGRFNIDAAPVPPVAPPTCN